MKTRNIIVSFWVVSALMSGSMGFTMGYYSEFLRAAGLDEFWTHMVNFSFFITIFIFEIPTGLFADIFGRKWSLVISFILSSVSLAIYGLSSTFMGFVISEVIVAIGRTFASGAFDAWLTDSMENAGQKFDQIKVRKINTWLCTMATITTAFLGGLASKHGLNIPFFCGSIFFLITAIIAGMVIEERYFERRRLSFRQYIVGSKKIWTNSIYFARRDKNFLFLLVSSGSLMFAVMTTNMQWPEICKTIGYNNKENGAIAGIILLTIAFGSMFAGRFKYLANNRKLDIVVGQFIIGIGITCTLLFTSKYGVMTFFLLHELGRGAIKTLYGAYTQECITSKDERATLGSFISMVEHLCGALGLFVAGIIAEYAGFTASWVFSGTVLIVISLFLLRRCSKETN